MSTNEVEVQARGLGWRPKEEFKGKEADFVDAETYVKRGREVMPLLKKNNERLETELTKAQREIAELREGMTSAQSAVQELKAFNSKMTQEAVAQAKADLLVQLKQAKKDGDTDREVELQDQLTETSAALREAKKEPVVEKKVEQTADAGTAAAKAEFAAFQKDNDWYGTDVMKTSVANGIAQKLRGEKSPLQGRAFYDEVAAQTEAFFDARDTKRPVNGKTEGGGRSSGGGSGGQGKGTGYSDMPDEAQKACETFLKRDITVGKGKTFENADAFRKYYAETYFARGV